MSSDEFAREGVEVAEDRQDRPTKPLVLTPPTGSARQPRWEEAAQREETGRIMRHGRAHEFCNGGISLVLLTLVSSVACLARVVRPVLRPVPSQARSRRRSPTIMCTTTTPSRRMSTMRRHSRSSRVSWRDTTVCEGERVSGVAAACCTTVHCSSSRACCILPFSSSSRHHLRVWTDRLR